MIWGRPNPIIVEKNIEFFGADPVRYNKKKRWPHYPRSDINVVRNLPTTISTLVGSIS